MFGQSMSCCRRGDGSEGAGGGVGGGRRLLVGGTAVFAALLLLSGCGASNGGSGGGSSDDGGSGTVAENATTDPSLTFDDPQTTDPDTSATDPDQASDGGGDNGGDDGSGDDGSDDGDDDGSGGDSQSSGPQALDCDDLPGSGTFSDPYQLGDIDGPVVAQDCAPMTPGSPYNTRYFSFTLSSDPGSDAYAGASFTLTDDALGPVYPVIDSPGGYILKDDFTGYWTGTDPNYTGRYQQISDLSAGTYILRTDKLDTAIHSMTTPSFDLEIDPDYSS